MHVHMVETDLCSTYTQAIMLVLGNKFQISTSFCLDASGILSILISFIPSY